MAGTVEFAPSCGHLGEAVSVLILTAQLPHASPDLNGSGAASFVPEGMRDLQPCPVDGAGLEVSVVGEVKQGISEARDFHRARRNARIGPGCARARNTNELEVKLLAAFDRRHPDDAGDLAVKGDLGSHSNLLLVDLWKWRVGTGCFLLQKQKRPALAAGLHSDSLAACC